MNKLIYLRKKVFTKGKNHLLSEINFLKEIDKFAKLKNKTLLDIGCGNGKFLTLCSLLGELKHCIGIDPAEGSGSTENILDSFRKNIKVLNIKNIEIIKGDILNYDFGELKFDIITAIDSIHHIINTEKNILKDQDIFSKFIELFNKIYDILNDRGVFILYECSKFTLRNYFKPLYRFSQCTTNFKSKHSAKKYCKILKLTGFSFIHLKYYLRSYYLNKFKFMFSNPLTIFPFDSHYFLFAIKK